MISPPLSIRPGQSGLRWIGSGDPLSTHRPPQPAASFLRTRRDTLLAVLVVMAIASFNLFYRLGQPAQPIWDENYYLTSTARYELGYASFASHPPLGLMLIAAGDRLSGENAAVDWRRIAADKKVAGENMPRKFSYAGVRCASALFAVLASGLVFLLMVELTATVSRALLATSPFLFDTALIAQFRAAQLDAFQVCFATSALLSLVIHNRTRSWPWLFAFGAACALTAMVRANGILLLIGSVLPVMRVFQSGFPLRSRLACLLKSTLVIACGFGSAAVLVLGVHLTVARREMPSIWPAARADAPYITPAYRKFLEGEVPLSPIVFEAAVSGYRRFMTADIAGVGLKDANGSSPWLWPIGRKPIVYRWDSDGVLTAYVALIPNLAAWLISLFAVIAGLFAVLREYLRPSACRSAYDQPFAITLLCLWAALFGSAVLLSTVRVMYLYHYFLPLLCGWVLAALLLGRARSAQLKSALLEAGAFALIVLHFIVLSPFALHRPISDPSCQLRTVLSGVRVCDRAAAHLSASERPLVLFLERSAAAPSARQLSDQTRLRRP